jgi:hypothetical protein
MMYDSLDALLHHMYVKHQSVMESANVAVFDHARASDLHGCERGENEKPENGIKSFTFHVIHLSFKPEQHVHQERALQEQLSNQPYRHYLFTTDHKIFK